MARFIERPPIVSLTFGKSEGYIRKGAIRLSGDLSDHRYNLFAVWTSLVTVGQSTSREKSTRFDTRKICGSYSYRR